MDASPQNLDKVMRLLLAVQSPQDQSYAAALETFNKNKMAPGFNLCLVALSTQRDRPLDERRLAAIVLNNNCKSLFARRIAPEDPMHRERESIKELLLKQFDEPEDKVSCYFALAIANASRHEWPRNWDALFPSLLGAIQHQNSVVARHGLYTLKQVLDKMADRQAVLSRGPFCQVSAKLLEFVFPRWVDRLQEMIRLYEGVLRGQPQPALTGVAEQALMYSKCLHSVIMHGVDDLRNSAHCREFFQNVGRTQTVLLRLATQQPPNGAAPFRKMITKALRLVTQTVVGAQLSQPLSFYDFVEPYLKLFCVSLQNLPQPLDPDLTEFGVLALDFLKNVIGCRQYDSSRLNAGVRISAIGGIHADQEALQEAQQKVGALFQPQLVENISRMVLSKYLPLQASDLERWRDEPEEFSNFENQTGGYEESLRSSAQRLVGVLVRRFPLPLAQILQQQLQQLWERCPPGAPAEGLGPLLAKEACFCVFGLCVGEIQEPLVQAGFDHLGFFRGLLKELAAPRTRGPGLVQAAAARTLGQWAGYLPAEAQMELTRLGLGLLNDRDRVLRLTVLGALDALLDGRDPELSQRILMEGKLLQPLLATVFDVLENFELYESKSLGFKVLQQVIGLLEDKILMAMDVIGEKLPKAWASSEGDDSRIRSKLLDTLGVLVWSLGPASTRLHEYLIRIIRDCCVPGPAQQDPNNLFLLGAGLELWGSVVRCSPVASKPLLELFQLWLDLHRSGNVEELDLRMQILEAYLFLVHPASMISGQEPSPNFNEIEEPPFLAHYGEAISQALDGLLAQNLHSEGSLMVLQSAEMISQLYPRYFQSRCLALLARGVLLLLQQYVLECMQLRAARQEEELRENQLPRQVDRVEAPRLQVPPKLLNWACSMLSRLLLSGPDPFRGFIRGLTGQLRNVQNQRPPQPVAHIGEPTLPMCAAALLRQHTRGQELSEQLVLAVLLDAWIAQMDEVTRVFQKKLNCLALCNLIPTGDVALQQRVPAIINVVSGVVLDLEDDQVGYHPTFHEARAKPPMQRTDPDRMTLVHGPAPENHIQLRAYAYQKMSLLAKMDKAVFDKIAAQIHPSCLEQIQPPKRQ